MFSTQRRKHLLKKFVKILGLILKSAYVIYDWPLSQNNGQNLVAQPSQQKEPEAAPVMPMVPPMMSSGPMGTMPPPPPTSAQ